VSLTLSLFEKHGVSQKQFDATIQYYAAHPKKMKSLYETMKTQLQERIAGYEQTVEADEIAQNIWKWTAQITIDSTQLPLKKFFYLPVKSMGNYTLKATVTLFENDSTQQPAMVGYFLTNKDSVLHDTINKKTTLFTKSENAQVYTLSFSVGDSAVYAFEGYWLDVKRDTVPVSQHITLKKLRILYNNEAAQTIASDLTAPALKAADTKPAPTVQPVIDRTAAPLKKTFLRKHRQSDSLQLQSILKEETPKKIQ
jgi:hypothetical protein